MILVVVVVVSMVVMIKEDCRDVGGNSTWGAFGGGSGELS